MFYKIKFTAFFKDGQIFGAQTFQPGSETVVDEQTLAKVRASGAEYDIVETLIKNPLKNVEKKDDGKK